MCLAYIRIDKWIKMPIYFIVIDSCLFTMPFRQLIYSCISMETK